VWTLTLRPSVRFQDGTRFNAAAVLANARRWSSVRAARGLVPHLFAVDAPRPDEVRFLLDAPVADLPARLASPRLGIVSPGSLEPQGGTGSHFRDQALGAGTGPFQAATRASGRLELSRYAGWWGSAVGLGPALDAVRFLPRTSSGARLGLLLGGSAQVADPLDAADLRRAEDEPLLEGIGGPAAGLGIEGSVRGIDSARGIPRLSAVWLTDVGGG
jgi:ABC-type transport system substrate-binding protein